MKPDPISVLIVDDSALMRNLVSKFFDDTPDIQVVGTARNGRVALERVESLQPDVIVLDLEMPEMDGITFLKERRRLMIGASVIILSSLAQKGARITMDALSLGAADFIPKPSGSISQDIHKTRDRLVDYVRVYGARRRRAAPDARTREMRVDRAPSGTTLRTRRQAGSVELIAVGISTGGPNALREIFPHLDAKLKIPMLVVQHMPKGFTEEFAKSLDHICPLSVKEACDGDLVSAGRVLIAPGDHHMTVEDRKLARIVRLSHSAPVNGHRPSVDVLFSSVAETYGNRCLAIIMTGMGRDGAKQIGAIYRKGGLTIAQDEPTSIVYGMPKAAIELGAIHRVLPLGEIARAINETS